MYLVTLKTVFGYGVYKFETLEEAKEMVKVSTQAGMKEITLSKEIPVKVTVSVEI